MQINQVVWISVCFFPIPFIHCFGHKSLILMLLKEAVSPLIFANPGLVYSYALVHDLIHFFQELPVVIRDELVQPVVECVSTTTRR
jgi:hypothetical protein